MGTTNCVFGPVPSRRLGQSLGIDPVRPKSCNFNCVYCQLGRTGTLANERKIFFPPEEIVAEVEAAIAARPSVGIDWVTFIASGETCLHSRLGWMIREVRRLTSLPLALITNGSLFGDPGVRREVAVADAVLPSLDAGSSEVFLRINRPHLSFTFERHVEGLIAFRKSYHGNLWLEIMLVAGVNDSEAALRDMAAAVKRIQPDQVHICLPSRPPAEEWVRPPKRELVMRALNILGNVARAIPPPEGEFELGGGEDVVKEVLEIIVRHPMREDELENSLSRWSPERVREALEELKASGHVGLVDRLGSLFWIAKSSDFGETTMH